MNAKANLSGANFTGNINAPVVDALSIRENGINTNTIYETKSDATASNNAQNTRIDVLQSMLQEGPVLIGGVLQTSVNTTINMNHQLVVRSSTLFPMRVSPAQITMNSSLNINSTTNPSCVIKSSAGGGGGTLRIDNGVHNNASIGFYNNQNKYWTAGMRSGNFVIASDYITTNRSGGAIQNDAAMQVNQDGFVNLPNDMNLWGDIYCKRNFYTTGVVE